jgi:hypothetical protein
VGLSGGKSVRGLKIKKDG